MPRILSVENSRRAKALNEVALANGGHEAFVKTFEDRSVDTYHVPMWEGDFSGKMKQLTMVQIFRSVDFAPGEKKLLWDLPGHGKAYSDCGSTQKKGCDNVEGHSQPMTLMRLWRRNCRRKACPKCFEGWAAAAAERALARLATYVRGPHVVFTTISDVKKEFAVKPARLFHEALVSRLETVVASGGYGKLPIHLVLSPPQGVKCETMSDFRALRKMAYRIAKESGFVGGAMPFHPYRLHCVKCDSAIPEYWKECPKCGGSAFHWVFSVHFHAVGFGWIENTKEGFERHGWVVKNLGVRENCFWTFQYLLSHAGVSKVHTVTWFGKLAYNVMGPVPPIAGFREICPECRRLFFPLIWLGGEDRGPPELIFSENPALNDLFVSRADWGVYHG